MAKKKKAEKVLKMFITTTGNLFSEKDLKQYEVPQSRQAVEEIRWGVDTLATPYDLAKLMLWLENDVTHNSCVRQKTNDAVGIGWHLEDIEEIESSKVHFKVLSRFFNKVNEGEDIINVAKKVFLDYEGCGNGYIEIVTGAEAVPGVDKSIKALYHVTAPTVRWSSSKDKFVQQVGQKKVYFKRWGDERVMNSKTGIFGAVSKPEEMANSLLQIKQYTPRSFWYGLPEWLPAIYSMYGTMKEKTYNLDFFANFGIPAYAVIISGITVKPETEEGIKNYFETEVKNNPHKTMVFGLPQGGEVKFEKLSVDAKEASFRIYRRDNRDEVLTAHHVPPYRVGIVQSGQLGGTIAEEVDRMYLDSVINPRQRDFEWLINQIIVLEGFGVTGWEFKFNDIDIEDRKMQAEIDRKYFEMGAITSNELRKRLGKKIYDGGDVFYIPSNLMPSNEDAVAPVIEGEEKADTSDYIDKIDTIYDEEGEVVEDFIKYLSILQEKGEYHRARVAQPSEFMLTSIRVIPIDKEKGVTAIAGQVTGFAKATIHAYMFEKGKWTVEQAKEWLSDRDIEVILFEGV